MDHRQVQSTSIEMRNLELVYVEGDAGPLTHPCNLELALVVVWDVF